MLMGDMRERMLEARGGKDPELKFSEFRVLGFVGRHDGCSLSEVANGLGLALPAASKIVQALVERGHMERETSEEDRRQVRLHIGPEAKAGWKRAKEYARAALAQRLAPLTTEEREQLAEGLRAVRRVLSK